jgi:phospholipase/carboxylesterase/glyoxalase family protein
MNSHPHAGQPLLHAGAPLDDANGVVVMLHGRGAGAEDILSLAGSLDPGEDGGRLAYLAPAAANHTWYPFSFLSDIARNEPYLSSALSMLEALIADLETRGFSRSQMALLGFSQGACLCSEFAARHAARFGGVIALSGGLIGPPGTAWRYDGSFDGMPAFFGCSDVDAHIPAERVNESAAVFARMGAVVTARLYPGMGHTVSDDEISEAKKILKGLA